SVLADADQGDPERPQLRVLEYQAIYPVAHWRCESVAEHRDAGAAIEGCSGSVGDQPSHQFQACGLFDRDGTQIADDKSWRQRHRSGIVPLVLFTAEDE